MNIPQPRRGFKINNEATQNIMFSCNVPDVIAEIKSACDEGLGSLHMPGSPDLYSLWVNKLYDIDEVLAWLRSFEAEYGTYPKGARE